jgi:radical SAM protein (TIGR01212 family)
MNKPAAFFPVIFLILITSFCTTGLLSYKHDPKIPEFPYSLFMPCTEVSTEPMMKNRYNDFSSYLRRSFGCRVQKLTVDAGFSCPNRDGTLSSKGCLYCDGHGAGSGAAEKGRSISEQIEEGKMRLGKRYNAKKFIAYFQAFTNTYAPPDVLRERYDEALVDTDIVGLAVGTRPDCIDVGKLDLIEKYTKTHMVWMEYGLQSMHDRTLKKMNRGHSFDDFVRAVRMTQDRDILICAHVILGLPGESKDDILSTACALADLSVDGVKIHNLYVQDDTPLAKLHRAGGVQYMDQRTYVDWVVAFLERLSPHTVVQRLTGDPEPSSLVSPAWAMKKQQTLSFIQKALEDRGTYQGLYYREGATSFLS